MIEGLCNKIVAYENDEMTEKETVVFFQELISNGMAWTLQGHYGRMAEYLIEEGLCNDSAASG